MKAPFGPLLGKRFPCPEPPNVVDVNVFPGLDGGGLIPEGRGALFGCGLGAAGRPKLVGRGTELVGLAGLGA